MLQQRCLKLWEALRRVPTQQPHRASRVCIPAAHTSGGAEIGGAFRPDEHYFQVRINELFLSYQQEWFTRYDPLLLVISEFEYSGQQVALPVVVGPAALGRQVYKSAQGSRFVNVRVAGWHPYRGGALAISLALCRVPREGHSRPLLRLIEQAAGALDFATAFAAYSQVAHVVLEGVETLLGAGLLTPLLGWRSVLHPAAGGCVPDYRAIIDMPAAHLHSGALHVRDGRLVMGATPMLAAPFCGADYVLYQLARGSQRSDIASLPFSPLYEQIQQEAAHASAASWRRARARLFTLLGSLVQSPDLTPAHATLLQATISAEIQRLHERALAAVDG
jgi:hypothetical protein